MGEYRFFPDRPVSNYRKSDSVFIVCSLLLWGLGIFTLYVCSPGVGERFFGNKNYFLNRQIVSSVVGFSGFFCFSDCCSGIPIKRREQYPSYRWQSVFCFWFIPACLQAPII